LAATASLWIVRRRGPHAQSGFFSAYGTYVDEECFVNFGKSRATLNREYSKVRNPSPQRSPG
jgi:hypothetical protein